jgi:hypothetical protein
MKSGKAVKCRLGSPGAGARVPPGCVDTHKIVCYLANFSLSFILKRNGERIPRGLQRGISIVKSYGW